MNRISDDDGGTASGLRRGVAAVAALGALSLALALAAPAEAQQHGGGNHGGGSGGHAVGGAHGGGGGGGHPVGSAHGGGGRAAAGYYRGGHGGYGGYRGGYRGGYWYGGGWYGPYWGPAYWGPSWGSYWGWGLPLGAYVAAAPAYGSYYDWRERERVVAEEDVAADAVEGAAAVPADELFMYPRNDQSAEQQATDRYACHRWAADQTGFDPTRPLGGVPASTAHIRRVAYHRAMGACLEGRGYSVK